MALSDELAALERQILARTAIVPKVAVLLGTGLGGLAEKLKADCRIPYGELTGMPVSTAESHKGEVIVGTLAGVPTIAFSGRLHCYEGYAASQVVVPVRLARKLGAQVLIMGSAVGGLDPEYRVGDIAVIEDHLNLMGVNPLVGPNDDKVGPRWPDMIDTYDAKLRAAAIEVALKQGVRLHQACYGAVLGPNLETRAEYRMLRTLGADVVGMSTVPEAIAAVHCGLRTLVLAVITDRCLPDALEAANVPAIIAAAKGAEPTMTEIITGVLARL